MTQLREGVAGIYAQKKLDKFKEVIDTKIGMNLLENLRQYLVTKTRQQMPNERSKHSDRVRSTLLIL